MRCGDGELCITPCKKSVPPLFSAPPRALRPVHLLVLWYPIYFSPSCSAFSFWSCPPPFFDPPFSFTTLSLPVWFCLTLTMCQSVEFFFRAYFPTGSHGTEVVSPPDLPAHLPTFTATPVIYRRHVLFVDLTNEIWICIWFILVAFGETFYDDL